MNVDLLNVHFLDYSEQQCIDYLNEYVDSRRKDVEKIKKEFNGDMEIVGNDNEIGLFRMDYILIHIARTSIKKNFSKFLVLLLKKEIIHHNTKIQICIDLIDTGSLELISIMSENVFPSFMESHDMFLECACSRPRMDYTQPTYETEVKISIKIMEMFLYLRYPVTQQVIYYAYSNSSPEYDLVSFLIEKDPMSLNTLKSCINIHYISYALCSQNYNVLEKTLKLLTPKYTSMEIGIYLHNVDVPPLEMDLVLLLGNYGYFIPREDKEKILDYINSSASLPRELIFEVFERTCKSSYFD